MADDSSLIRYHNPPHVCDATERLEFSERRHRTSWMAQWKKE